VANHVAGGSADLWLLRIATTAMPAVRAKAASSMEVARSTEVDSSDLVISPRGRL